MNYEIKTPLVPNFVKVFDTNGTERMVSIEDLTDEEIKMICEKWSQEFLKKKRSLISNKQTNE